MDKIIFDGKWTFPLEWKHTSRDILPGPIYIRTAHMGDFIYVMFDVLPDMTIDENEDYSVVCFDAKSEQSVNPDDNDFLF